MPAFIRSHKNVRDAIFYCLVTCLCLIIQLLLTDKNAIKIVFEIIIPFTAAICFGCYAITMAMDRPIILICPPTVYFVSLLLFQLISVEVGVKDTYPFVTLIEMIPFAFFSVCVATCRFKKITNIVLKIFSVGIIVTSIILAVLAIFFKIVIFINRAHYIMNTFAMIFGLLAIAFFYWAMIELVKIAGIEKRTRHRKNETAEQPAKEEKA